MEHIDGFASLTGFDEENILLSLFARHTSKAKVVTKINRTSFNDVLGSMDLGSIFYPRYIAADVISRYVRAMENSLGSNVETLYKLVGGKAEALEFRVTASSALCGIPLQNLRCGKTCSSAVSTAAAASSFPRARTPWKRETPSWWSLRSRDLTTWTTF